MSMYKNSTPTICRKELVTKKIQMISNFYAELINESSKPCHGMSRPTDKSTGLKLCCVC